MTDRAAHPYTNFALLAQQQQQQHQPQQQQPQLTAAQMAHQMSQRTPAQMQNIPGVGQDTQSFWHPGQQPADNRSMQQPNMGQQMQPEIYRTRLMQQQQQQQQGVAQQQFNMMSMLAAQHRRSPSVQGMNNGQQQQSQPQQPNPPVDITQFLNTPGMMGNLRNPGDLNRQLGLLGTARNQQPQPGGNAIRMTPQAIPNMPGGQGQASQPFQAQGMFNPSMNPDVSQVMPQQNLTSQPTGLAAELQQAAQEQIRKLITKPDGTRFTGPEIFIRCRNYKAESEMLEKKLQGVNPASLDASQMRLFQSIPFRRQVIRFLDQYVRSLQNSASGALNPPGPGNQPSQNTSDWVQGLPHSSAMINNPSPQPQVNHGNELNQPTQIPQPGHYGNDSSTQLRNIQQMIRSRGINPSSSPQPGAAQGQPQASPAVPSAMQQNMHPHQLLQPQVKVPNGQVSNPSVPQQPPMGGPQQHVISSPIIPFPDRTKFMENLFRGHNLRETPVFEGRSLDLYQLHVEVMKRGGFENVTNRQLWVEVVKTLGFLSSQTLGAIPGIYRQFVLPFDSQYIMTVRQQQRNLQVRAQLAAYANMSVEEMQAKQVPEQIIQEIENRRAATREAMLKMNQASGNGPATMQTPHRVPQNNLQPPQPPTPQPHPHQPQAGPSQIPQQQQQPPQPGMHMQFPGGPQIPGRGIPMQPNAGMPLPPGVPDQMVNHTMAQAATRSQPSLPLRAPTQAQIEESRNLYQKLFQEFDMLRSRQPIAYKQLGDQERQKFPEVFNQTLLVMKNVDHYKELMHGFTPNMDLAKRLVQVIGALKQQEQMLSKQPPSYVMDLQQLIAAHHMLTNVYHHFTKMVSSMKNQTNGGPSGGTPPNPPSHPPSGPSQLPHNVNGVQPRPGPSPAPNPNVPPQVLASPFTQPQIPPPRPLTAQQQHPQPQMMQQPPPQPQVPEQPRQPQQTLQPPQPPPGSVPPHMTPAMGKGRVPMAPPMKNRTPSVTTQAPSLPVPTPSSAPGVVHTPVAEPPAPSPSTSTTAATPTPATPAHVAQSPQTPKSPKKVAVKSRARKGSMKVPPAAAPHVAPPEPQVPVPPSPVRGVKRQHEPDTVPQPGVAPAAQAAVAPSPKRLKTEDWSDSPREVQVKTEAAENPQTMEEATGLFEQMLESMKEATNWTPEMYETIQGMMKSLDGTEDFGGALNGGAGEASSSDPLKDDIIGEFFDFSSFPAETPDLVPAGPSANPSPASNVDPTDNHGLVANGVAGPMMSGNGKDVIVKVENPTEDDDPLKLGILQELDSGEPSYYNTGDWWKWGGEMQGLDNPWAMIHS